MKQAGELAKTLGSSMLATVSSEHREMARDAISWFTDRPVAAGIDDTMGAMKLAAHLSRSEVTLDELKQMVLYLDSRVKFQPTVLEFLEARDAVRAEARRVEVAKYRLYKDAEGREFACDPEMAEERGYTEVKFERSQNTSAV